MFKAARWRSEKNKSKSVFRLQFHATQVPQIGWETMTVSVVPVDVGKPTARLEKTAVIDGECHWMNQIKETVKFIKDPRTGKNNEKVYRFLVSANGSAKSGFLGEISINLADYAEGLKPTTVSLPLKEPDSGVILHVTIQRIHADMEGREGDENGDVDVRGSRKKITSHLMDCDEEEGGEAMTANVYITEDISFINSQAQVRMPPGKTISQQAKSNGNLRKSSNIGYILASGSDSSSGQYTPKKNRTANTNTLKDSASFLSPLSKRTPQNEITGLADLITDYRDHQRQTSNTDSSTNSPPNGSTDWSTNSSLETGLKERSHYSDVFIEKHRSDAVSLVRHLEVLELELQTLRKQVVMERRQGEDLLEEISSLKVERDTLRRECEELKGSQMRIGNENVSKWSQFDGEGLQSLLEEIKQELNHEKSLNSYLSLQLEKTQESNTELILAVQELDELLEKKNMELICTKCSIVSIKQGSTDNFPGMKFGNGFSHSQSSECKQELFESISDDDEQHALEALVMEHDGVKVEYSSEQKIVDLKSEIELYKKDRDDMEMQMEQLALDYEILKQENHTISSKLEQTQLREQLRMQYECSAHGAIITDLEAQVRSLEKELEEQAAAFEADLETIAHARVEQEQRAIRAEEALRKTRWNTANTAEQLKEEFEGLSAQISSTFDMNEKLATQALTEASELRLQKCHLEELLEESKAELSLVQDQCHVKLQELLSLIDLKTKEADKLLLELKEKSGELENQKKLEAARQKAFSEDKLLLKSEMERLEKERVHLSKERGQKEKLLEEMEQLKVSTKITETWLQEKNLERDMLDREIASMREEANKSLREIYDLKQLKDEKEAMISSLNSEVTTLKTKYDELKHSLFENELEKENLRKQVFHLRGDLKKKEDTITSIEKKLKDTSVRSAATDGALLRNKNKSSPVPHGSKEVASLREKIKLLEGKMKLKDAALEDTKNSFLKKEKDLSNKIEELEKCINQSKPDFCEGIVHKDILLSKQNRDRSLDETSISARFEQSDNAAHLREIKIIDEDCVGAITNGKTLLQPKMGDTSIYDQNDIDKEPLISGIIGAGSKNGEEGLIPSNNNRVNIAEVLGETEILKEKNKVMESELKEMQERYSEISLKFAEVEGERQQLVMTIRTLRNSLKN